MNDLPNGFTGYAGVDPGLESAGAALRRNREAAQGGAAAAGRHARIADTRQRFGVDAAFDLAQVDDIPQTDQRWAWVQVDLSAIRHNVVEIRRYLQPRCRLMACVNADAFGHGAMEVAKAVLGAGAESLAVATVPEAVQLREAGISSPILVLSQPPASSIPLLVAHHIVPTVYEPDFAIAYGEVADLNGVAAPYHLAVNTGMNRIGIHHDEAVEFLRQVSFHRALELAGVFTEYATAGSSETLGMQVQARRFLDVVNAIKAAGFDPGTVHSADSAAIFRYPEVHFDLARAGQALYGFHPCMETRGIVDLRPAMSVHARITDARLVPLGEGVSYAMRYRSPGSVKICTVPIGYGDGLSAALSGHIDFIMQGRYFRQVGDICMDQCMFEADMRSYGTRDRIDPQVGDEVIVVGSQGAAQVTIEELAEKLGTVPQEISIGFSRRLPRVYR